MDVLVVATDALKALSLEATLDVGGHRVVGLAESAAEALDQAKSGRPALAIVQLGSDDRVDLISELRDDLCVPSLLVGTNEDCTDAHRAGALGLLHEPCGSTIDPARRQGRQLRSATAAGHAVGCRVRLKCSAMPRVVLGHAAQKTDEHGQLLDQAKRRHSTWTPSRSGRNGSRHERRRIGSAGRRPCLSRHAGARQKSGWRLDLEADRAHGRTDHVAGDRPRAACTLVASLQQRHCLSLHDERGRSGSSGVRDWPRPGHH